MATAYTIRYGRENAIVGPCVDELVSTSRGLGFGDEVGPAGSVVCGIGGGGSMTEWDSDFGTAGSGSDASASSAEEVSIVICFVGGGFFRVV